MSDRLPGDSWSNPIWHRDWRIYVSDMERVHGFGYEFAHDDFDGADDANDNRAGHGKSVEDCKRQIDEMENQ